MQFKAEHSIWHSCQLITLKRGNSSNSFDFKEVYSLYRFTENLCNKRIKREKWH